MTFIIGFQLHCRSEHKQAKLNKIKGDMCKSGSIFLYLQSSTLFKWLLKFFQRLSQRWMITAPKEKYLISFHKCSGKFRAYLGEKNSQLGAKIIQYLRYENENE